MTASGGCRRHQRRRSRCPRRAGRRALVAFAVVAVGLGWALTGLVLLLAPDEQASLLFHALMVYPISYAPFAAGPAGPPYRR